MLPNIVCAHLNRCERFHKPFWFFSGITRHAIKMEILCYFSMDTHQSRHIPLNYSWKMWFERTADICKSNKFLIIRLKSSNYLIHLRSVLFAARIFFYIQTTADGSDDDVEPKLLNPLTKFESCILQR